MFDDKGVMAALIKYKYNQKLHTFFYQTHVLLTENFHADSPTSKSNNMAVISNYVYHLQNNGTWSNFKMHINYSNRNYFGQCFPKKLPNVAAFTLYVYVL